MKHVEHINKLENIFEVLDTEQCCSATSVLLSNLNNCPTPNLKWQLGDFYKRSYTESKNLNGQYLNHFLGESTLEKN